MAILFYASPWVEYFDNTHWNADSNTFPDDAWNAGGWWDSGDSGKSGKGIEIKTTGMSGWQVGFRPTKVRVKWTLDEVTDFWLYDETSFIMAQAVDVVSDGTWLEYDLTWDDPIRDIWKLRVSKQSGSAFDVTGIQFHI